MLWPHRNVLDAKSRIYEKSQIRSLRDMVQDSITDHIDTARENSSHLRGAWRDHCFPEPFSWFLHETGLESLKITSARCFLLKCQRKDSKKAKEHRQFRGVLGRWRTAAIDRFMPHSGVEKPPFSQFFLGFGVSFGEEKPFVTSRAMPVSNKKEEFE